MSDYLFPSKSDIEAFCSAFGSESILHRLPIPSQNCHGTQAASVIRPASTKEETLSHAWELVRSIAQWILAHASELPPSERYEITVGWSHSVRRLHGQIFKVVGDHSAINAIAASTDWGQHDQALRTNWEYDVFDNRPA